MGDKNPNKLKKKKKISEKVQPQSVIAVETETVAGKKAKKK